MKRVVLSKFTLCEFYFGKISFYTAFQGCYENQSFFDLEIRVERLKKLIVNEYPYIDDWKNQPCDGKLAYLYLPEFIFDNKKKIFV